MTFAIRSYEKKKFPTFCRPEVVGYFSLTGQNRDYSQDLKQLKYYYVHSGKDVSFDLNEGIDGVIRKASDLDEKLDHVLRWIINNCRTIAAKPEQKRWLKPDFICFRGLLTKICCTPYEKRDGWIICATKFQGTIYLYAFDTEEQEKRAKSLSQRDLQFMSWGFKFEQYMLSDSPNSLPNTKEPVNEAEEFCCMFLSKLEQNLLLYGAEMDGIDTKDIVNEPVNWKTLKFIELKTNRHVRTSWQDETYRKKLLKWWCQSFLVGIEDVVCGTRSDKGRVFELETVKVSDMPKIAKKFWSASNSINFCDAFLNHIKAVIDRDYGESVYKFEYSLQGAITMAVLPSSSKFSFLPDWYIEQANKIIKSN